jgi:hypothetical protein
VLLLRASWGSLTSGAVDDAYGVCCGGAAQFKLCSLGRGKRRLAGRRWRHVQNYADAKTSVVDEIMARAAGGPPVSRRR